MSPLAKDLLALLILLKNTAVNFRSLLATDSKLKLSGIFKLMQTKNGLFSKIV
jgi:hypothetical protein